MVEVQHSVSWLHEEWLSDLQMKLQLAGEAYQRCPLNDPDAAEHPNHPGIRHTRTGLAMLAVGTVMNKIAEIPGMSEHPGLAPLHDLVAALWELGRGGQPRLLQPSSGVGKGGESVTDRWVRQHALLFVSMMEDVGMKGRPACRLVAKTLAEAGHVGRKRNAGPQALSEGTIVDWRNRSRQRDFTARDPQVARFLERNLNRLRSLRGWPYPESETISLMIKMAKSSLMRSKSG